MSKPVEIDEAIFNEAVLQSKIPVFVDFWGPNCRPCLMIEPVIDELAEDFDGKVSFARVNVSDNPQITRRYGVMGLPTLMVFKEGQPVDTIIGFRPKDELKKSLETAL